jgi:hypothetical protein
LRWAAELRSREKAAAWALWKIEFERASVRNPQETAPFLNSVSKSNQIMSDLALDFQLIRPPVWRDFRVRVEAHFPIRNRRQFWWPKAVICSAQLKVSWHPIFWLLKSQLTPAEGPGFEASQLDRRLARIFPKSRSCQKSQVLGFRAS